VDAFAGGLAVQAVLALWLQQRYGASTAALGLLFFATNLLSALSQAVAPALAARRGLLQTMLVPHFVSNVLLLAVPASPTFWLAAALLCVRHTLSKIDVPARQAFTAAVVTPEQRVAAASLTTVARSVAVSASPLTSSLLLSGPFLACGGPLLLGGGLAIAYDLSMWCGFRSVPLEGESRPHRGRHRARRRPVRDAQRHDQGRPARRHPSDRSGLRRGSGDRRPDLGATIPIRPSPDPTRPGRPVPRSWR
jgi:MFS family permease